MYLFVCGFDSLKLQCAAMVRGYFNETELLQVSDFKELTIPSILGLFVRKEPHLRMLCVMTHESAVGSVVE